MPASARGMLRPGLSVSSPIDAHASKPAQDRNAATTPLITAEAETPLPEKENAEKSIPVDGAPPRAKITMTSTIMDRMPIPSIASRIFGNSLMSRPDSRNEITARHDDDDQPRHLVWVVVARLQFCDERVDERCGQGQGADGETHVGAEHRETREESRPRPDGATDQSVCRPGVIEVAGQPDEAVADQRHPDQADQEHQRDRLADGGDQTLTVS